MRLTYFGSDGAYGDALELSTFDTTEWTTDQWEAIDRASSRDRQALATEFDQWHKLMAALAARRDNKKGWIQ